MFLNKKALAEKRVIQNREKLRELWKRKDDSIKLDKPIRIGWVKTIVPASNITAFSKPNLRHVKWAAEVFGSQVFSRRKDFLQKEKKTKNLVEVSPSIKSIYVRQLARICKIRPEKIDSLYSLESLIRELWNPCYEESFSSFLRNHLTRDNEIKESPFFGESVTFGRPWLFQTEVKPYYITHLTEKDGATESEKKFLYDWMRENMGWQKLCGKNNADTLIDKERFDKLQRKFEKRVLHEDLSEV